MSTMFRIGVNSAKEILSNPPRQFRHLNLIFTPFGVRTGTVDFPMAGWTDFAGVFLFRWYLAVLGLSDGKTRYARLPFWYTYEMWLRQTSRQWWRLSLVERSADDKLVLHETLVIPEVVEAGLLTASQKLLDGARSVGVWTEDCMALDALLKGRELYLEDLEAGRIEPPSFLSGSVLPPMKRGNSTGGATLRSGNLQESNQRTLSAGSTGPQSAQRRMVSPPILCPHCNAVLQLWESNQTHQVCPQCKHDIRLG